MASKIKHGKLQTASGSTADWKGILSSTLDGKVSHYLASIIFNHTLWLMDLPLLAYTYPKLFAYVRMDSSPD